MRIYIYLQMVTFLFYFNENFSARGRRIENPRQEEEGVFFATRGNSIIMSAADAGAATSASAIAIASPWIPGRRRGGGGGKLGEPAAYRSGSDPRCSLLAKLFPPFEGDPLFLFLLLSALAPINPRRPSSNLVNCALLPLALVFICIHF